MRMRALVLLAAVALAGGAQTSWAEEDCVAPRRGRRCTTAPLRPGLSKMVAWKQLGSDERIEIPIAYHVVRMSGEPELPPELLELQTEALNRAFVNTRISFRTASVDQGPYAWRAPTPICPEQRRRAPVDFVAQQRQRDPQSFLNVYLTGSYRNEASWPGAPTRDRDGIWIVPGIRMNWDYLPYAPELRRLVGPGLPRTVIQLFGQGDTLVHLVGHYLGLADTFNDVSGSLDALLETRSSGATSAEPGDTPPGDQPPPPGDPDSTPPWKWCRQSDDFVADTPVHLAPLERPYLPHVPPSFFTGVCRRRDTCKAFPGLDPIENFMADTPDVCALSFTAGQIERMENAVATYRRGFIVAAP